MGTHPIFESDFDCLTEREKKRDRMSQIGDRHLLQKRIPRSARYDRVQAKTDTGASMSKHLARVNEIQSNYRIQKGELFKRIRISTFAQLVLQVDQVNKMTIGAEDDDDAPVVTPRDRQHATFLDVINGTGELKLKDEQKEQAAPPPPVPELLFQPYEQKPYLLVDVRDRTEYEQCHIITALSYPASNFSRTMNPFSPEMYQFRNVDGKIIILYDIDGFIATECAHKMAQRGFENVFVLSGGMRLIAQKLSKGLTTGSFPVECFMSLDRKKQVKHFDKSHVYPADRRQRFSDEGLAHLSMNLDALLTQPSDAGSRVTRSKVARSTTSTSSRPWK